MAIKTLKLAMVMVVLTVGGMAFASKSTANSTGGVSVDIFKANR